MSADGMPERQWHSLVIHEFVDDSLDGDATLDECIDWVLLKRKQDIPPQVQRAIEFFRASPSRREE